MELTTEQLISRLVNAAQHLYEAGKYLSDIDPNFAMRYLRDADRLLSMINKDDIPKEKLTVEQVNSILDEIFSTTNEET